MSQASHDFPATQTPHPHPIPHESPSGSFSPHPQLVSRRPSLSLLSLTRVSPHVALEIEGVVKALATAVAHVAPCWAMALEVPSQHALQREGLGAKRAAKCPRGPGSRGQGSL